MPEDSPQPGPDQATGQTPENKSLTPARLTSASPRQTPSRMLRPWKVLLRHNEANEQAYVVETLMLLTPLSQEQAIGCSREAHKTGLSLLLTTHRERAELYQEQFASRQLTVSIEAGEG